jgi:hypothetical protein
MTNENLLPWEPEIYYRGSLMTMGAYIPNKGDECEECKKHLPENYGFLVSDSESAFCCWECLIAKARKYPCFYKIASTGAWK